MNPSESWQLGSAAVPRSGPNGASAALEDPRVVRAMEEYQARLEAGDEPDRQEFLDRHPDLAGVLAECLEGLAFVHQMRPRLQQPAEDQAAVLSGADGIRPEGPLGDFRIVREIGRGGMGVVYEAVQISLGRRVALKILPFAAAMDSKQLQRFKNEAQAAAHLQHQNIVPVHFVGCERGVHFYAMQFIEGQTLAAVIQELRQNAQCRMTNDERMTNDQSQSTSDQVPGADAQTNIRHSTLGLLSSLGLRHSSFFRTVAHLGVQAAEALEHAHQFGVIHRDIKPANLLVDAEGRLWITDFGLAHCQSQPGLTMTGDVVGTLRYMSPEQALAKRVALDARTDVYSLGATFYELLTLEPAYNGRNREEVLRQIAFEEPCLPSHFNKAVPAELETIALKAMAKSPEERYATAQELGDDLERYLKDEPIRARRPTVVQRIKKWTRRHLPVVWTAGLSLVAMLLLAVIGLATSTFVVMREKAQTDVAKHELERTLYYQSIAWAEREWSANNLGRVEQLLDACPADLRGWEWHYLKRLRLQSLPPLHHAAAVFSASFSPDGQWIASGSQDGKVTVWDATTGQQRFAFQPHERHVRTVAFSADGRLLATASWDKTVKVWGFDPQRVGDKPILLLTLTRHQAPVSSVMFSPDSQRLASAGGEGDNTVRVWDSATGQEIFILQGHNCVAYSPDGQYLVAANDDTTVKIWDAKTGREKRTLPGHSARVLSVIFSRDGQLLASTAGDFSTRTDREIKIWDARTGQDLRTLRGHTGGVYRVIFTPDGKRLASAGEDETVKLWDLQTGQEVLTLRGHRGDVRSVDFSPDGTRLISASHDRKVLIWDATPLERKTGQESFTFNHGGAVRSVAFSPDGRQFASAGDDETVRIWDFKRGLAGVANPLIQTLSCGKGMVLNVAFNKDGQLLASGSGEGHLGGQLKVWDTTTWKEIHPDLKVGSPVMFSPDGQHLAAVSEGFTIEIREATTGLKSHALKGHSWAIWAVAFGPGADLPRLASASADGTVRIWNVMTGKEIVGVPVLGASTVVLASSPLGAGPFSAAAALAAGRCEIAPPLRHTNGVLCVAFNHDGRLLASGGRDRVVKVWDAKSWQLLHELPDSTGSVKSVVFHPKDSRVLAWGSTDATVKIWDAATMETHTFHGHTSWVESVAFSPDGEWIASASLDGAVKIWKTPALPESTGVTKK